MKNCILVALLLAAVTSSSMAASVKPPKKQVRVVRTECAVVGTESKRVSLIITNPTLHAQALWARISEDVTGIGAMFLLGIPMHQDVLGNGAAPDGLGWRLEFQDSENGQLTGANQRHHYAFWYYIGATDSITAELGAIINLAHDSEANNLGDLTLGSAAQDFGTFSRLNGVTPNIGERHMNRFCQ